MAALGDGFAIGLAVPFEELHHGFAGQGRHPASRQVFLAELGVEEAVQEEIRQAGDDDFPAFFFDHAHDVVVGDGMELDVDFADQADARLHLFAHVDVVEFVDHGSDVFLEGLDVGFYQVDFAFFLPFFEQAFGRALYLFIGPRAV